MELVGPSDSTRRLQEELDASASSRDPVLLEHEQGDGVERVLSYFHARACPPEAPLRVRSARLFHGSPSAWLSERIEDVRAEPGGTLALLDLDLRSLPKAFFQDLLPVLDEQDVRLFAAFPVPEARLEDEPGPGRWKWRRLRLPPLRERPEDILALAYIKGEFGLWPDDDRPPFTMSLGFENALRAHHWRGNEHELRELLLKAYRESGPGKQLRQSPELGFSYRECRNPSLEEVCARTGECARACTKDPRRSFEGYWAGLCSSCDGRRCSHKPDHLLASCRDAPEIEEPVVRAFFSAEAVLYFRRLNGDPEYVKGSGNFYAAICTLQHTRKGSDFAYQKHLLKLVRDAIDSLAGTEPQEKSLVPSVRRYAELIASSKAPTALREFAMRLRSAMERLTVVPPAPPPEAI